MEAFPTKFCKTITSYLNKRQYQTPQAKKSLPIVKLGGGASERRSKFVRLRSGWRLKLKVLSPIKLMARVRDSYMNAMLGLAGSSGGQISGSAAPADSVWARRMPKARSVREGRKEFERKLIIEIYKSVAASRGRTDF